MVIENIITGVTTTVASSAITEKLKKLFQKTKVVIETGYILLNGGDAIKVTISNTSSKPIHLEQPNISIDCMVTVKTIGCRRINGRHEALQWPQTITADSPPLVFWVKQSKIVEYVAESILKLKDVRLCFTESSHPHKKWFSDFLFKEN